ncbi:hypothetical protein AMELA_G00173330 [Ameiurus melas]|uniref:Uncharacterized protein n=1 Tax=Ameiurus melas TaxID=219545 RepID=A0A7J6ACS0_AMEME|nr:hypothetical protein AMELA_G00173330 [Ameiurus melas]
MHTPIHTLWTLWTCQSAYQVLRYSSIEITAECVSMGSVYCRKGFSGTTVVITEQSPMLAQGVRSLLDKGVIEHVPVPCGIEDFTHVIFMSVKKMGEYGQF